MPEGHPRAEGIGAAPGNADGTEASCIEHFKGPEIGVYGLGAFDMEDGRELVVGHGCADLGSRAADVEGARTFEPKQQRGHAIGGFQGVRDGEFGW